MNDIKNHRRAVASLLILLGALLIFLAPDNAGIGWVLAVLGFALEGIAAVLVHRDKTRNR